MSQELRWRDDSEWLEQEGHQPSEQVQETPKYHEYQHVETVGEKRVEELAFFLQIFVFCLAMTLSAFLFLTVGLTAPLTLILSLVLSAVLSFQFKKLLPINKK
jgi:hypothetical protein